MGPSYGSASPPLHFYLHWAFGGPIIRRKGWGMTLRELVEGIARHRGWKSNEERGGASLSVPQGRERSQVVMVSEFQDDGVTMVRFTTRIGKVGTLEGPRLRAALELNLRLPHGCLAVDGDHLVMTETRPLRTTTPETSGDAIHFIARQADTYEKLIFGTDVH